MYIPIPDLLLYGPLLKLLPATCEPRRRVLRIVRQVRRLPSGSTIVLPANTTCLEPLKSPYPYFGGKSTIADVVWRYLGDTRNYVEPFFGSGAMLLARPDSHRPSIETVNDKDGFVSNFWRAVQREPEIVARWADWPVNENDLHARHIWLVSRKDSLTQHLEGDPDYYDAKIAGWWVWGMSCWIGSGFCSGQGAWSVVDGKLVRTADNDVAIVGQSPRLSGVQGVNTLGVAEQRPGLAHDTAQGIFRKRVHLMSAKGIVRQMRHLAHGDQGVTRQMPNVVTSRGGHRDSLDNLADYMAALQYRLRRVRVCSGDWTRVIGPAVTFGNGLTSVFLDPPYIDEREKVYTHDSASLAHEVRQWAIENGNNPMLRIAYCGYEDGFDWPDGWTKYAWRANGGYGNQGDGRGATNKHREIVYFSPHCLKPEQVNLHTQMDLFTLAGVEVESES